MEAYLGEKTMKLGFGLMRLPKTEDGKSDVEQTKKMVDLFMEAGGTYFDTAWGYGDSEDTIRQALVERYPRDSYTLATKLAAWMGPKTKEEAEEQFDVSLKRTGAGYFDFYLLHNISTGRLHYFDDWDLWEFIKKKKAEGKIKHIGFSYHDNPEFLEEVLKAHPETEFVQLQINYADWEVAAVQSRGVYEVARKYNKPIVIMEPLKGGTLANPPEALQKIFKDANPDASFPSWGIRFAASLPGVITVLSGMSNVEQMEGNLAYMKDFKPLTEEEQKVVEKARDVLTSMPLIPCTNCRYCEKVCPNDISIASAFNALNQYRMYGDKEAAKGSYNFNAGFLEHRTLCTECIECGQCAEACPQKIEVPEVLKEVVETLGIEAK